jgi:uncharacterized protein (DUF1330 family)
MTTYLVVDTRLTDPDRCEQYKLLAKPLVEQYGGEYLARGGKVSIKESDLWSPTRMVLIRFPSSEQLEAFYHSPEYQEVRKISGESAERTVFSLEGI